MPRPFDRGRFAGQATLAGRALARRRICRVEHQGIAVHAIAQAGRLRSIIKDVAEMAAATAAVHFGSRDAQGPVLGGADRVLKRPVKARPAGATLEFGLGRKQRQIATRAGEGSFAMFFQQRTRPWALGALLAQDVILLRRELRAPLCVGLFDLELLRGLRRLSPEPAETGEAKQAGCGEQNSAVNHCGLRAAIGIGRLEIRRRAPKVTPNWPKLFTFARGEPPARPGGIGGNLGVFAPTMFRGDPRPWAHGPRPAGWRAAWRRPRCSLAIGFGKPRLPQTILLAHFFAVAGQRARKSRTAATPYSDDLTCNPADCAARPHQVERREQPPTLVAP